MAKADPQRPFVHLDVQTAYSAGGSSPSLPEDYVRALGRQHPLDAKTSDAERTYLAIADYGLHSAVKTAASAASVSRRGTTLTPRSRSLTVHHSEW
jgi:hypothetical protein